MSTHSRYKGRTFETIYRRVVADRISEFDDYTRELETKFEEDKEHLEKRFAEITKELSAEEESEISDYLSDEYYVIEEIHIGMFRKSTLVSLYSFLENSMSVLCNYVQVRESYRLKLDDLKGRGIERARRYLEKVADINFDSLNDEWGKLKNLNRVRNCIVHADGHVDQSETLENIVTSTSGLSLKDDLIKVERKYVDDITMVIKKFLDELIVSMETNNV